MTSRTAHKDAPAALSEASPLEKLSIALNQDMEQVDALILECMQSEVKLIPQLAKYLISAGGKRIRPLMTLAAAKLFNADMQKAYPLAAAVEFIHTATLLHDDVVDESEERRGQKAANLVFGNQASVLVGDFLFSKSFELMVRAESLEILRILSSASAVIAQGEVKQLSTANNIDTTLDAYMDVIASKTAALFAASCEIGPVLAGASAEDALALKNYGNKIGIAFQIIDDTLDYAADQKKLGKEIGDDFKEGKMTAPVIYALENATDEEREFWRRTINRKKQKDGDFDTALEMINTHGAIERSTDLAKLYAYGSKEELTRLQDSELKKNLSDLAEFTISRAF